MLDIEHLHRTPYLRAYIRGRAIHNMTILEAIEYAERMTGDEMPGM